MSKKFLFALMGFGALMLVGIFWLIRDVTDVGLWALWVSGLSATIGIYTGGNVVQKKVISENYRPELDENNVAPN
jgi:hypothetical protein